MKTNLLAEMIDDLKTDVALSYARIAEGLCLPPSLPSHLLDRKVSTIITRYRMLSAMHKGIFRETLFRIAVADSADVPTLALIDHRYAFALALAEVAEEYKPRHNPPALAVAV